MTFLSDEQIEQMIQGPIKDQIEAVFELFTKGDYNGPEWTTTEEPNYPFLIAAIEGIIENINTYDFTQEERAQVLKALVKIKTKFEKENEK